MTNTQSSKPSNFGLSDEEAETLGEDAATRIRALRGILVLAQLFRYKLDQRYRTDGLTTQQAALLSIVRAHGAPSLGLVAQALGTSHQNAKQLVAALERKGFLEYIPDPADARVRRLHTTAKNERYWRERDPDDFKEVLTWFEGLSPDEAETLLELVSRLYRHLTDEPREDKP